MARQTLVLDASVAVKWFSPQNENALAQALSIRDAHIFNQALIMVPDLFYYEVTNAIAHKKFFSLDMVNIAAASLFALNLRMVSIDSALLINAVNISQEFGITIYDSSYVALARCNSCPLVTANPKHQKPDLGCRVIPLEEWGQRPG